MHCVWWWYWWFKSGNRIGIKKNVKDDKFIDWEVDFDLEWKSLIKKLIEERERPAVDGETVKNLTSKISK